MENIIRNIIEQIGDDPNRAGLLETPDKPSNPSRPPAGKIRTPKPYHTIT